LKSFLTAVLVLFLTSAALADLTMVQKVQVKRENEWNAAMNQKDEHVETVYFKGKKLRVDVKDNKAYTIADFEKGFLYTVEPDKKAYSKVSMANLAKLRDVAFYQIKQRLDQLDNLKPEEKAAAEMMWGPMLKKMREEVENKDKATKVEVENPEETKKIAGHECRRMIIKEDGRKVLDMWLTDEVQSEVNLAEVLSSVTLFSESVKSEIKKIKGFSLGTTYIFKIAGQSNENSSETIELKTDELPADKFEIPEDFTNEESPLTDAIKQYDEWMKEKAKKSEEKKEDGEKTQEQEQEQEKEASPAEPEKAQEEK